MSRRVHLEATYTRSDEADAANVQLQARTGPLDPLEPLPRTVQIGQIGWPLNYTIGNVASPPAPPQLFLALGGIQFLDPRLVVPLDTEDSMRWSPSSSECVFSNDNATVKSKVKQQLTRALSDAAPAFAAIVRVRVYAAAALPAKVARTVTLTVDALPSGGSISTGVVVAEPEGGGGERVRVGSVGGREGEIGYAWNESEKQIDKGDVISIVWGWNGSSHTITWIRNDAVVHTYNNNLQAAEKYYTVAVSLSDGVSLTIGDGAAPREQQFLEYLMRRQVKNMDGMKLALLKGKGIGDTYIEPRPFVMFESIGDRHVITQEQSQTFIEFTKHFLARVPMMIVDVISALLHKYYRDRNVPKQDLMRKCLGLDSSSASQSLTHDECVTLLSYIMGAVRKTQGGDPLQKLRDTLLPKGVTIDALATQMTAQSVPSTEQQQQQQRTLLSAAALLVAQEKGASVQEVQLRASRTKRKERTAKQEAAAAKPKIIYPGRGNAYNKAEVTRMKEIYDKSLKNMPLMGWPKAHTPDEFWEYLYRRKNPTDDEQTSELWYREQENRMTSVLYARIKDRKVTLVYAAEGMHTLLREFVEKMTTDGKTVHLQVYDADQSTLTYPLPDAKGTTKDENGKFTWYKWMGDNYPKVCTGDFGTRTHTYHDLIHESTVFDAFVQYKHTDICLLKHDSLIPETSDDQRRQEEERIKHPLVKSGRVYRGEELAFDLEVFRYCLKHYDGVLSPALQFAIVAKNRALFPHIELATWCKAWDFLQHDETQRLKKPVDDFISHVDERYGENPLLLTTTSTKLEAATNIAGKWSTTSDNYLKAVYTIELTDDFCGYNNEAGEEGGITEIVCPPRIPKQNIVKVSVLKGGTNQLLYTLTPQNNFQPQEHWWRKRTQSRSRPTRGGGGGGGGLKSTAV